jgi:hypothetical protein
MMLCEGGVDLLVVESLLTFLTEDPLCLALISFLLAGIDLDLPYGAYSPSLAPPLKMLSASPPP